MKRINLYLVNTLDDNKIGFVDFDENHGEVYIAAPFGREWSSVGYIDKEDSENFACRVISKRSFLSVVSKGEYTIVDYNGYIKSRNSDRLTSENVIARVCGNNLLNDPYDNSVYNRIGYAECCDGCCEKWQIYGALAALKVIIYRHYFMERDSDGATIIHSVYAEEECFRKPITDINGCNKAYAVKLDKPSYLNGMFYGLFSGAAIALACYILNYIFDFSMKLKPFIVLAAALIVFMSVVCGSYSKNYLVSKQLIYVSIILKDLFYSEITFGLSSLIIFPICKVLNLKLEQEIIAIKIDPDKIYAVIILILSLLSAIITNVKHQKKEIYLTRGW